MEPSKAARTHTALLESQSTAAWAGIIASESFFKLLVAVNDSHSSFYLRFRWETASSFTHWLESSDLHCTRVRSASVCSSLGECSFRLLSALARNRTWSTTFAKSRAVRHTPRTDLAPVQSRVTRPGIEPGPTVSKTVMLSSTPASHIDC